MEDHFLLEKDENFEKVCGELLLTNNKRVAILCTLCDNRYKSFKAYINHLYEEHEKTKENSYEYEETDSIDELEENLSTFLGSPIAEESDNFDSSVNIEIGRFDNEALKEEEIPITTVIIEETNDTNSSEINSEDTYNSSEFPVIRNVKRRTLWNSEATNDDVEKKHKCPICGLGFKEKHNMHHHLKRHSSIRDYACPECGRAFYTPSEVKTHMRLHSGERDYLCSDCGRSFKKNSDLRNHQKRHDNQRDFKCTICDKAFFNSKTLKNHMVVHCKDRPFLCPFCPSSFTRTLSLKNHIKLHENKRAYKCNICGAGFNQQAGLFSHAKAAHK